ncbi:MAG TPA: AMP-binding protein [Solirubrobacteraceae bacterium]|jgi:fatty-acyl-CoA synthase|nr:AMP-binding protein [Solirubrobacteraceae bacterium]
MPISEAHLTESYWPADPSEPLLEITLAQLLRNGARDAPDRIALVDGVPDRAARRRWSYSQLLDEAEGVARALRARLAPGASVAVYASNRAEWTLLQHGASLAGMLLVPLNPAYKASEVEVILRSSRAAAIFHDLEFRGNDLDAIVADMLGKVEHLQEAHPLAELRRFIDSGPRDGGLPDVAPEQLLQIQYTSGTTGVPKGALLHHKGVVNTSRYVALRAGFPEGGVWINAMPMFHIAGSAVTSIGCLAQQGTYVMAPGFTPDSTLELIESERGNASLLVPTMVLAILDHPDFARRDLSSMTTVLSGAAAVPAALVERTRRELGCGFTILFGQTEINGVVSQTRLDDSVLDQAETLGQPLPNVEVKIADPATGAVLPIGEAGEIMVRGYQNMQGYHGMPDATATAIERDGWLHTGDLATMDDRGFLRIAGRLKDMIIRGGMNLFPREIEDVIFDHPRVAQVSVLGIPDEKWGELVGAVVIATDPDDPPSPDELNEHCRARLAAHKSPRHWYFVQEFPLTPSGKIQKFKLSELIAGGAIAAVDWDPSAAVAVERARS